MAKRLEFNWLPTVKYTLVLMVYILAGSVLIFYLEECKNDEQKLPKTRRKLFTGNVNETCRRLAADMFLFSNETRRSNIEKSTAMFLQKCGKLLNEEVTESFENSKCSWSWKNIRKWIKFSHSTFATIGYHEFKVQSSNGQWFVVFYSLIGIPLATVCYIYFGRIVRICIRRAVRRIEAHFFNREEPLHMRHKVVFYNSVLIILVVLLSATILRFNSTNWSFIQCLYYYTGTISTSGNNNSQMDTRFFETNMLLSFILEIIQIIGLGLVSSLIQAGVGYMMAKQRRQRLDLHDHRKPIHPENKPIAPRPKQNVHNGTIAMDSLLILVKDDERHNSGYS